MRRLLPALVVLVAGACGRTPVPDADSDAAPPPPSPCPDGHQPADPIDYGTCEIERAKIETHSDAAVLVATAEDPRGASALASANAVLDARAESYVVVPTQGQTVVVGRDAVGAMYGALEVAERLRVDGAGSIPPPGSIAGAPSVAMRAANLFLVLPAAGESAWWFRDPAFWADYLDLMAHARLDFLDLHAMYDLDTTIFPNALPYFATSATFPGVGAPPPDRAANLATLQQVVAMAAARGIRVGLMSYRSDTTLRPRVTDDTSLSGTDLQTYTYEAARDLATRVPGLARLGFRIGESGQPESWFETTFVRGVKDAATGVGVYTRTWLASKADIVSLSSAAGGDLIVESKYNGEHFAAPYAIAGGEMAKWGSYSFQTYLQPPAPYAFVFQVRAGGTHRIFRFAHYDRARRTALSFAMSQRVAGFTLEAAHAYFPQRDFYHADPRDRFSEWTFRRDELSYWLLGRLAYDPSTDVSRFRWRLASRVGTDALWDATQAASDIVPWIQAAATCGPDQRDYAPELELGGDIASWASLEKPTPGCGWHGAFDSFAIANPSDAAADLALGRATTRLSPRDVAAIVLADAKKARAASQVAIDSSNAEARDVVRECVAVADLGEWFGHKLRAATALAVYAATDHADWLDAARAEAKLAAGAWTALANDTSYVAPFDERMRMAGLGYSPFHWSSEVPRLADDGASIDAVAARVAQNPPTFTGAIPDAATWLASARAQGPGAATTITPADPAAPSWTVNVKLGAAPAVTAVRVLYKPFASETDWNAIDATGSGTWWSASVPGTGAGAMFAVEATAPAGAWRYPDVVEETPYRVLPP